MPVEGTKELEVVKCPHQSLISYLALAHDLLQRE